MASFQVRRSTSKADIARAMRHVRCARLQLSRDDIGAVATRPVYVFRAGQRDIEWLRRQPFTESHAWAGDDPARVVLLGIARRMAESRDGNLHCYQRPGLPPFAVVERLTRSGIEARILSHEPFELPEWRPRWQ